MQSCTSLPSPAVTSCGLTVFHSSLLPAHACPFACLPFFALSRCLQVSLLLVLELLAPVLLPPSLALQGLPLIFTDVYPGLPTPRLWLGPSTPEAGIDGYSATASGCVLLFLTPFLPCLPHLGSLGPLSAPPMALAGPLLPTLPSCRSEMEQASMKACAMTERQASMWSVFSMSKTNWGFFRMFTQKRRGRLWDRGDKGCVSSAEGRGRQIALKNSTSTDSAPQTIRPSLGQSLWAPGLPLPGQLRAWFLTEAG